MAEAINWVQIGIGAGVVAVLFVSRWVFQWVKGLVKDAFTRRGCSCDESHEWQEGILRDIDAKLDQLLGEERDTLSQ